MPTPPNALARSLFEQGAAACKAGAMPRALELFNRALAADRTNIALPNRIGGALMSLGALAPAQQILQDAVHRFPNDVGTLSNLGTVLANMGKTQEAAHYWNAAVTLDPNFLSAKFNLAGLFANSHQLDHAEQLLRELLARDPKNLDAWLALGPIRFNLGEIADAERCFEKALEIRPNNAAAQSGMLFSSLFDDRYPWQTIVEKHVRWGQQFTKTAAAFAAPALRNDRSSDRRLRVGYISPFFRGHVNTYLSEPILREHDRSQFEVFAYCVLPPEKSDESLLQPVVDHWRRCERMSDEELATTIRNDAIDILIDLTAHMESQRLGVFVRKPAPIQINYLAYPATSGLRAMDYRVTCPRLDPPGTELPIEPEKLLRLPDTFWVYPTRHPVPIGPPPSQTSGLIAFGCLNAFAKVRDACLTTWAKILSAVPGSTLTLLIKGGEKTHSAIDRVAKFGIDPSRVRAEPLVSREQHLDRFNAIDVCLDTFPYGGHTTTHDALWMGVPVIAMKGDTAIARAGECILSHVGLSSLVAKSADEYVQLAARVAADLDRRVELRKTLRAKMLASPLCDANRFTKHLETAYRAAWKRWCAGLPPDHLTIS